MHIRRLENNDSSEVSNLAIRSKAHWGYSIEEMDVFRQELTMSGKEIEARLGFGIEYQDRKWIGFYTLLIQQQSAELEHLFVDPSHLGHGIGSMLLDHAKTQCHSIGVREMNVVSDPNAAGFYEKRGAALVREIPSSIPGRMIPQFRINLMADTCGFDETQG